MGRKFTKHDWPKKPAKLDCDCFWVSVESVKYSTGVREDELAWCTEVIDPRRMKLIGNAVSPPMGAALIGAMFPRGQRRKGSRRGEGTRRAAA